MRNSGILMPISALPSKYGIGSIGEEAYRFIDFLKACGQTYWQILPIGPTSYGDSPYQSFSAFAANPYFIDLDILMHEGYLLPDEYQHLNWGEDENKVDYELMYHQRLDVLRLAASRLPELDGDFQYYNANNIFWLDDYAVFMALKQKYGGISFTEFSEALRLRDPVALEKARVENKKEIHFWRAVQYFFSKQWKNLKKYANENGIKIIGDIPIYVSPDSADLWAHSELFLVDENKKMIDVAGCPPDAFSEDGQLWGNPLYDWDYHKETEYDWWIKRLRHATEIYDVVRIDHFRGFSGYYAIPYGSENARTGEWRTGPSNDLIDAVKNALPNADIIAEDLGFLTDDVIQLLKDSGYPGMKVLQFAFDTDEKSTYLPHNYTKNCVCYTGTHDNSTTEGWQKLASDNEVNLAMEYLGVKDKSDLTYGFIRGCLASVADRAVIPIQDWLKLDDSARINTPSTLSGNWLWRIEKSMLSNELAEIIKRYTKIYGRLNEAQ